MSETKDNLLAEINIPATESFALLDTLDAADHRYIKDLKINVSNALRAQTLNEKEALLLALAVSVNQKHTRTFCPDRLMQVTARRYVFKLLQAMLTQMLPQWKKLKVIYI